MASKMVPFILFALLHIVGTAIVGTPIAWPNGTAIYSLDCCR